MAHPWLTYRGMSSRAGHPCRSTIHWRVLQLHGTGGRGKRYYVPPEDTPAPGNTRPGYCLSIPAAVYSYTCSAREWCAFHPVPLYTTVPESPSPCCSVVLSHQSGQNFPKPYSASQTRAHLTHTAKLS